MGFQNGCLRLYKGVRGASWQLHYRDRDGHKRMVTLGAIADLPRKTDARRKAQAFLAAENEGRRRVEPVTVEELIGRYRREELTARRSTRAAYSSLLARHIEPQWGKTKIADVRPGPVEQWLRAIPKMSPKTRANIRQLLHVLFECARRWEWCDENPITLVRQSAKKTRELPKLSVEQYRRLLAMLVEPVRTMVLLAGCLGLRVGEIVGLKWGDIDLAAAMLHVRRDIYQGHEDEVKTDHAQRAMPLAPVILESLKTWRQNANYKADGEYVFAQDNGHPMWPETVRALVLRPLGRQLGIERLGWHAFRHLFASVLQVAGAEAVVMKELMGHAEVSMTMAYAHAMDDKKRAAAASVAGMLVQ